MIYSLQRRGDRYQRFGMDHMLVIGMTIKYIDRDSTLLKLLLVSRTFNEMLKE